MMNCGRHTPAFLGSAATLSLAFAAGVRWTHTNRPEVTLMRTPGGGIQPQVAVDRKGVLHLIYFSGDPSAGDIYYVRKAAGAPGFSNPLRVNSVPASAIAVGSVRGPQFALGKGGRVHVAWMGAHPMGSKKTVPMLYTRLNDPGTAFEPERNVLQQRLRGMACQPGEQRRSQPARVDGALERRWQNLLP